MEFQEYNYKNLLEKYLKKNLLTYLREKNYPLIPLSEKNTIVQIGYGYKQKRFWCTDYNQIPGFGLARNKKVTNDFLNEHGVPAPIGKVVTSKSEIKEALAKIAFPITIKPAEGTHGGKGVKANVTTVAEAIDAFQEIHKLADEVLVEENITGNDHRVLVINYEVVAVLQRIPARIKGDGQKTIKGLIDEENDRRVNIPKEKKVSCLPIPIDETTKETLGKQNLSLSSVLAKGNVAKLRFNSNICTGGESIGVTGKIHPQTKELCEKTARLMGLKIAGIDLMSEDISKPVEENNAKIIEVNTRPGIMMHKFPSEGEPIDTVSIFANKTLPKPEDLWIPIQKNGKEIKDFKEIESLFREIPRNVSSFSTLDYNETIENSAPKDKLVTYLTDPLIREIVL